MSRGEHCRSLLSKSAMFWREYSDDQLCRGDLNWAFTSSPIHSIWTKGRFVFHRFKSIDLGRSFTEAPKCTIGHFTPPPTHGGFSLFGERTLPPHPDFSCPTAPPTPTPPAQRPHA
ncbi:hypothetical protein AVEN_205810-1 [Araneus ventricosus]|uniref:Uncharacterized protein n=1 Tax=Araneus ventricosus TaxID=182803 RepID=A0A4Y2JMF1_ARAVE|nr:hypothetical protein AVEN_205810-1 [Araneus ventricosus]